MKKLAVLLLALLMCAVAAVALVACNDNAQHNVTVTVIDGDRTVSVQTEKGAAFPAEAVAEKLALPEKAEIIGYYTNADMSASSVFDTARTVDADITLYVAWDYFYTVTFVGREGDVLKTQKVRNGGAAEAPEAPVVPDYEFIRWEGSFDNVTSDITVSAVYNRLVTLRIRFASDPDGSFDKQAQYSLYLGEKVDLDALLAAVKLPAQGKILEGKIYNDAACTQEFDIDSPVTESQHGNTLYIKWDYFYTVEFYGKDGAELLDSCEVQRGHAVAEENYPDAPAVEGWSFDKWEVSSKGSLDNVTENLEVTAVYKEIFTVTVQGVQDHNGTETVDNAVFGKRDGDILTVEEIKEAFVKGLPDKAVILGVFTDAGCNAAYTDAAVTESATLYVKWEYSYTVRFFDKDGAVIDKYTQHVLRTEAATAPSDEEMDIVEGHTFKSWDTDFSNVTSDLNVKPEYSVNTYTVTFDLDGGTIGGSGDAVVKTDVQYGSDISELLTDEPVKVGTKFRHWYIKGGTPTEEYVLGKMPAGDLNLVAYYSEFDAVSESYNGVYDGKEHQLFTVTVNEEGDYTVEYKYAAGGNEWSAEIPVATDAGTYDIAYRVINADNETVFESTGVIKIAKRDVTVTIDDQHVVYKGAEQSAAAPAEGENYTVSGLADGHTAVIEWSAAGTDAGSYVLSVNVVINSGTENVRPNYNVKTVGKDDAAEAYFIIDKAKVELGDMEVRYDGEAYTYGVARNSADSVPPILDGTVIDGLVIKSEYSYWSKSQQRYTFIDSEDGMTTAPTFTDGGAYTVRVRLDESDNWEGQIAEVSLKIQSVYVTYTDAEGEKHTDTPMTVDDALAIEGTAENPVTVSLFGNTVLTRDAAVHPYTTLILPSSQDISYEIGKPTYNSSAAHSHIDKNADYLEHTLHITENAAIDVYGDIIVCGLLGNAAQGVSGHTTGKYSAINNNGALNLENGSNLDLRGYIKGFGEINAKFGSRMFAPFIVYDFRGGTNTVSVFVHGVVPFNIYDMFYNVQCSLAVEYGAIYTAYCDLYASSGHRTTQADIINTAEAGTDSESDMSLFVMQKGSKILIDFIPGETKLNYAKKHNPSDTAFIDVTMSGRNRVTLIGDIAFGDLQLSINVIINVTVKMSEVLFPFSYRNEIVIGNGTDATDVTMPYSYKLLPGASIIITDNAALTIKKEMVVYSEFTDLLFGEVAYTDDLTPAQLCVEGGGTLIFSDGAAFGGQITTRNNSESKAAKVITGKDFVSSAKSREGNSGGTKNTAAMMAGLAWNRGDIESAKSQVTFILVLEITEFARFDNGVVQKTDTPKSYISTTGVTVNYTERIRQYNSYNKLEANTTYIFDTANGNWTAAININALSMS